MAKLTGRKARCVGHKPLHWDYQLTCEDYSTLTRVAEGRCGRCDRELPKPCIDHDYGIGKHAVRGLVCHSCNSIISKIEMGWRPLDELTTQFLLNPFHDRVPAVEMSRRFSILPESHRPGRLRRYARPAQVRQLAEELARLRAARAANTTTEEPS